MMTQSVRWIIYLLGLVNLIGMGYSQHPGTGEAVVLRPQRTETAPVIDGILNDPVWQTRPLISEPFIVNQPVYGEKLEQKTHIWLSYDSQNIYVAYHCFDDHPDRIRASMTRRDAMFAEDWIDMDLDTLGTRQMTYEHACNPLGIQGDLINSVSGGESANPDWVWYSAGKMVANGYVVEVRIPLKSLKYRGGKIVTMNIGFFRNISHSGTNASWPKKDERIGYFNSLCPIIFEDLDNQLRLEALPAFTFSSIRDRQNPENWAAAETAKQAGLDLKYGITPTSNLELTINPDFSQVETDQFQIQANQRYPIFFSEKRPFFMEIGNQLSLAGANGEGNIFSAVHTRNIVDPAWGAKFIGEFSRFSLGVVAAGDEWPGRDLAGESNPDLGKKANFIIARNKYLLGGDNYIGAFYSGREFGDNYNRVIAADSHFRLGGRHSFNANGIYSFSGENEGMTQSEGHALTLSYDYSQRAMDIGIIAEDYSNDFRMDSAFYNRTGFHCLAIYVTPHFYPKWHNFSWLRRLSITSGGNYTHDKLTGGNDLYLTAKISARTLLQGNTAIQFSRIDEFWGGRNFIQNRIAFGTSLQPKTWFNSSLNLSYGGAVNYQQVFLGRRFNLNLTMALQLGNQLRQELSYTYQDFHRADDNNHVFDINILVSRSTFQFNKNLFVRSLIQYDSFSKRVLTDLLASFTLIPGTVMHVGYGLLHEKTAYANNEWQRDLPNAEFFTMKQSFFCKVSYRWQF